MKNEEYPITTEMMRKALADPVIGPQILDLFAQMVRSLGGRIDEDLLAGAKRNLPMFTEGAR